MRNGEVRGGIVEEGRRRRRRLRKVREKAGGESSGVRGRGG